MAKDQSKSPVNQQIDENLRRVYDEALQDGIPDKFRDLIRQLKESQVQPAEKDHDDH
jgi:hypothetical protein